MASSLQSARAISIRLAQASPQTPRASRSRDQKGSGTKTPAPPTWRLLRSPHQQSHKRQPAGLKFSKIRVRNLPSVSSTNTVGRPGRCSTPPKADATCECTRRRGVRAGVAVQQLRRLAGRDGEATSSNSLRKVLIPINLRCWRASSAIRPRSSRVAAGREDTGRLRIPARIPASSDRDRGRGATALP